MLQNYKKKKKKEKQKRRKRWKKKKEKEKEERREKKRWLSSNIVVLVCILPPLLSSSLRCVPPHLHGRLLKVHSQQPPKPRTDIQNQILASTHPHHSATARHYIGTVGHYPTKRGTLTPLRCVF